MFLEHIYIYIYQDQKQNNKQLQWITTLKKERKQDATHEPDKERASLMSHTKKELVS